MIKSLSPTRESNYDRKLWSFYLIIFVIKKKKKYIKYPPSQIQCDDSTTSTHKHTHTA